MACRWYGKPLSDQGMNVLSVHGCYFSWPYRNVTERWNMSAGEIYPSFRSNDEYGTAALIVWTTEFAGEIFVACPEACHVMFCCHPEHKDNVDRQLYVMSYNVVLNLTR